MTAEVTARFVIRFRGLDEDVSLRCEDDDGNAMARQLGYQPKAEVQELYGLDGWKAPEPGATLPVVSFEKHANAALAATLYKGAPLSSKWKLDPAVRRPGHGLHNGGWVDDAVAATTTTAPPQYKSCTFRLRLVVAGPQDYDLAHVGGMTVKVDYWISLSLP